MRSFLLNNLLYVIKEEREEKKKEFKNLNIELKLRKLYRAGILALTNDYIILRGRYWIVKSGGRVRVSE